MSTWLHMFDMTGKYIRDISKMDFATRYGESSVLKKSDMVSRSCRSFEPLKTAEPVLKHILSSLLELRLAFFGGRTRV